eukprot:6379637-Amphidinium_carterae.1
MQSLHSFLYFRSVRGSWYLVVAWTLLYGLVATGTLADDGRACPSWWTSSTSKTRPGKGLEGT